MFKRIVPALIASLYMTVFGLLGLSPLWDEIQRHSAAGAMAAVFFPFWVIGAQMTAKIVERGKRSSSDLIFGWAAISFTVLLIPAATVGWPESAFGTFYLVGLWPVMWSFRWLERLGPAPVTISH
ncbi:hypothetical protein HYZ80_03900 [Candidatus Parcubacteria bacterium]|nr:hypothetical protein [Candidatus Parcubacteria bacterium]